MTYGIEIKNIDGEIILDNTPYSVMRVMDGYPKTIPRNSLKTDPLFKVEPGEAIFVRAEDNGSVGGNGGSFAGVGTTQGDLSYVKIKSCENLTATGYGLAVYAKGTSTPQLVFSDNIKFAKLVYAKVHTIPSKGIVKVIPKVSAGMNRYVSLYSFGMCGNRHQDNADLFKVSFGIDTVTFSVEAYGFGKATFTSVDSFQILVGITIIEC
jgi:hypothetical protein